MTTPQPSGADRVDHSHEQEALLLVELLRTARLSLLYAERGAARTALLRSGLMPLLSRRAGDPAIPAGVRTSGVVVPFPDRRNRPSAHSARRRREIVVYCDDWTDSPLASLRQSVNRAVGAAAAEAADSSARLTEVLANLSQRLDANFVVLLDRFEDVVRESLHGATEQFVDELAEAVNQVSLPANFLISLTEEARPRLGAFRTRIPGFDDFSLKLSPAPNSADDIASARRREQGRPRSIDALPVLTEPLTALTDSSTTPRRADRPPVFRAAPKAKREPLPRLEVRVEDVYAMIDAALSRISKNGSPCSPGGQREKLVSPTEPAGGPEPALVASRAPTRGRDLRQAIERMERRLGVAHGERDPQS